MSDVGRSNIFRCDTRPAPLLALTNPPLASPSAPPALLTFATRTLGFAPDSLQRQILQENPANCLLLCSRQWGKTALAAIRALWLAQTRPQSITLIVSRSGEQARKVVEDVRGFAARAAAGPIPCPGDRATIRFANGSIIRSRPSTPDAARGYTAHFLIVDEAAFVTDELYGNANATLASTGGGEWLLSTAGPRNGFFYQSWIDQDRPYARYQATAEQCPRISRVFLDRKRATMSAENFQSNYMCEFAGAASSLFPGSLLDKLYTRVGESYAQPRFYAGLDLGQSVSHSALVVLRKVHILGDFDRVKFQPVTSIHYHVDHCELFPLGLDWTMLARQVADRVAKFAAQGRVRLSVDFTGIGNPVYRTLVAARPRADMQRVVITGGQAPSRHDDGTLAVPRKDLLTKIQTHIGSGRMTFAPTLAGGQADVLLAALQSFRPDFSSQGSADAGMALGLGLWGAE